MPTKKIAIIVQRYGDEICGGGEYYAKQLAEHLTSNYDVDVLTTTSLEYMTWDDHYEAGCSILNGVRVIRFKPEHERDWGAFNKISQKELTKVSSKVPTDIRDDELWIDTEGPYCPNMVNYLEEHGKEYDVVFVITYIYYTAVRTIPVIKDRCVFIPTAHDEIWIRLTIFQKLFRMPRYFAFLTEGEQNFVRNYFKMSYLPGSVVGFGVDVPKNVNIDQFREKFGIEGKYLIYVGRVDVSKSCDEMITYFQDYKKAHPGNLKLVLMGEQIIDVPRDKNIIVTGFVTEQEKFDGIMGSEAMICPSKYESLCIALLEGMACGKPVLANKACPILEEQCKKSKAGFAYANSKDFSKYAEKILHDDNYYQKLRENALNFTRKYYNWNLVSQNFRDIIEYVANNNVHEDRDILGTKNFGSSLLMIHSEQQLISPAFMERNIAACMISSDEYAPICGVALASLIANTNADWNYDILILCSDISAYNMKLMLDLAKGKKNISIRFVNLKEIVHHYKYKLASYYNEFTYYRLFIPLIFKKYEKVLYLDSDLIINHDIAELYQTDITDYFVAAARELTVLCWQLLPKSDNMRKYLDDLKLNDVGTYVQGGVALYNIKKFNKELPVHKLVEISTQKAFLMADQDIINIYCKGAIRIIPNRWNVVNMSLLNDGMCELYNNVLPDEYFREYVESRQDPYIVHYSGQRIPCLMEDVDLYHYFWTYARETPFYEQLLNMFSNKRIREIEAVQSQQTGSPNSAVPEPPLLADGYLKRVVNVILPVGTKRRKITKKIVKKFMK
jgi:lipopolysaccharide biosynthesis glycosyltransferase/glycosyltransferase involved in cell wall biosynthesis